MFIPVEHIQDGVLFRDSIELPDDHEFSESEIETMKSDRINNYFALLSAVSEVESDGE